MGKFMVIVLLVVMLSACASAPWPKYPKGNTDYPTHAEFMVRNGM